MQGSENRADAYAPECRPAQLSSVRLRGVLIALDLSFRFSLPHGLDESTLSPETRSCDGPG